MSEVKNKGGRPRRAPGEKLQRVTLNLRPGILVGLDLIARDRQTSLSQAAEFALAIVLRGYKIDGAPALKLALDAVAAEEGFIDLFDKADDGTLKPSKEQKRNTYANFFRRQKLWRILMMPERLRTKEEQFLLDVAIKSGLLRELPADGDMEGAGYEAVWAISKNLMAEFESAAIDGFRTGLSATDVAASLKSKPKK